MLYNLLSFFNKSILTFVCNSYPEKESLKIRKVTKKNSNFNNSLNKVNIYVLFILKLYLLLKKIWKIEYLYKSNFTQHTFHTQA